MARQIDSMHIDIHDPFNGDKKVLDELNVVDGRAWTSCLKLAGVPKAGIQ
jgi:hypothetical protein